MFVEIVGPLMLNMKYGSVASSGKETEVHIDIRTACLCPALILLPPSHFRILNTGEWQHCLNHRKCALNLYISAVGLIMLNKWVRKQSRESR